MKEITRRVIATVVLATVATLSALGLAAMPPAPTHVTTARPAWNGNGVWTSATEPMCSSADSGHWGIGRMGTHFVTLRCESGAWGLVQTSQIGA